MYTHPIYQSDLVPFANKYTIENVVFASFKNTVQLPNDKICRFCGKMNPEVNFKNDAHLIPKFLGNQDLLSDCECDNCNSLFSSFESHFANFIGITRTLWALTNQNFKPLTMDRKEIVAKNEEFYGANSISISSKQTIKSININMQTGENEINYSKRAYIPLSVYKAILKIALSVIKTDDVVNYKAAFRFLLTNDLDYIAPGIAKVLCYEMPYGFTYQETSCTLFRKKSDEEMLPTHIFMLCVENIIYEIPIPFNLIDNKLGVFSNGVYPIFCPPLFSDPPSNQMKIQKKIIELSKTEKVTESECIKFNIDPALLSNLVSFDPVKGVEKPAHFDPKSIVKIYIINNDGSKPTFPNYSNDSDKE